MALELFVIYHFNLLNTCFHSKGETLLSIGNPRVHPFTLGCIFQIQFQILNSSVTTNSLFKYVTNQEHTSYIFVYVCVCVYLCTCSSLHSVEVSRPGHSSPKSTQEWSR